jgi:hypothetical protein
MARKGDVFAVLRDRAEAVMLVAFVLCFKLANKAWPRLLLRPSVAFIFTVTRHTGNLFSLQIN